MKGLIILDKRHDAAHHPCDRYELLFNKISEECGFDFSKNMNFKASDLDGYDVILIKGRAYLLEEYTKQYEILMNLPSSVTIIPYYSDLQVDTKKKYNNKEYVRYWAAFMNRANIIMSAYKEYFIKIWSDKVDNWENKFVWYPHFVPKERYESIPFNENPKSKCIITGRDQVKVYPVRSNIINKHYDGVVYVPHPGYLLKKQRNLKQFAIKDNFARLLNKYVCGLATGSRFDYVLGKYFEVAASGALLMGRRIADADEIGFKPNENYVAIDEENFYDTFKDIVANTDKYRPIREAGRKFVLDNHTIENRVEQFKKILERI